MSGALSTQMSIGCPICSSPSSYAREEPGWGEWRVCDGCTLEFVHPFELPAQPTELYTDAYAGRRPESGMQEFNDRLATRRALVHDNPTLWFWTPAFDSTLDWLKGRVRPGGTVFEVGCGLGWVLHTLRREGFEGVGLDVAEAAVELNRADGFRVWHGTVETVPEKWVEPDAIVSFFMLHHVPEPLAFLRSLRKAWPQTPVALAQYGPSNRDPVNSTPPRTLTLWNEKALTTAFRLAGYDASVAQFAGTGNEWGPLRPLRKLVKRTIGIPPVYRLARRIEQRVLPRVLRPVARDAYVVLALAEPIQEAGS